MKTPIRIVVLCLLLVSPSLFAQTDAPPKLTPAEVETLLAPIALYPDALVGIILPASTNAADIVLAARYLGQGGDIAQIDKQAWDESVRSLAHYPDVLKWMDENLEWTQQLGVTFLAQPDDVMTAMQRLRARAQALGNLPTTSQLTVINEDSYIRIVPTVVETIYVPYYDPAVIYVSRYHWGFGPAWVSGPWLMYDCNWVNRTIWFGAWRPVHFHRPAWRHVDRRPPPRVVERHTWRPNPHRPAPPRPSPRPGHIVRPRPIADSLAAKAAPSSPNRPAQRPGANLTDSRRNPGGKGAPVVRPGSQERTSQPKNATPPPRVRGPREGDSAKPPPSAANRPPRNPKSVDRPLPEQRQSRDISKARNPRPGRSEASQPREHAQPRENARRTPPPAPPPQVSRDSNSEAKSSSSSSSGNTTRENRSSSDSSPRYQQRESRPSAPPAQRSSQPSSSRPSRSGPR